MGKSNEEAAREEVKDEFDYARSYLTHLSLADQCECGDVQEVLTNLENNIFEILSEHGIMHR